MIDRKNGIIIKTGEAAADFFADCLSALEFLGEVAECMWEAIRNPRGIRWRETLYYMEACGSNALPIVLVICFLMGVIMCLQGLVQLSRFGADVFVADLVGLAIVMELGPLMVAMISTGQAGSAFAAEIGTMKVSEEIDALITMGFVPSRFLVVPKMVAMIVVMPLLTVFGDIIGILGGMVIGVTQGGMSVAAYHHGTVRSVSLYLVSQSMIKSVVFAVIIAFVGCMRGFESSRDAQGVGRSATSAVVTSIFLVVVADMVLAMLFNVWG